MIFVFTFVGFCVTGAAVLWGVVRAAFAVADAFSAKWELRRVLDERAEAVRRIDAMTAEIERLRKKASEEA